MEAKYKIGDRVNLIIDSESIYVVIVVIQNSYGAFLYNIEREKSIIENIPEHELERANLNN